MANPPRVLGEGGQGFMKYEILLLPSASVEMIGIKAYLAEHSAQAAQKFRDEVERQIDSLENLPKRFPHYEKMPVFHRMLVLYDYQVFYAVDDDRRLVQIHHILHGHRNIQKFLEQDERLPKLEA